MADTVVGLVVRLKLGSLESLSRATWAGNSLIADDGQTSKSLESIFVCYCKSYCGVIYVNEYKVLKLDKFHAGFICST